MTSTTVALLTLVLQSAPAAQPAAQTPQDCIKTAREFSSRRMKELGQPTTDNVRALTAERLAMLRECAAQFDMEKTSIDSLPPLVELLIESQQPDLAQKALARGIEKASSTPAHHGRFLALAVRLTLREPKSAERNDRAERYADALDGLGPDALEHQIAAHNALNGYYRYDDIDSGIIKHSQWLIDTGRKLAPDLRKRWGPTIVEAYVTLSQAVAGQGENTRAIEILETAKREWSDVGAAPRVEDSLARYRMVGAAAPPVTAPVWLNRAETTPLDLQGKVTLLQFTAHWCVPCKESYPGMKRLEQRFAKDPFQVVFYTQLYGYFEGERNLTPEQEIERDRKYYAGYGFTLPIAIGPRSVEDAYRVGGIPQIYAIDKKGNVRLVMVGYDDANEEKLASFIKALIDER